MLVDLQRGDLEHGEDLTGRTIDGATFSAVNNGGGPDAVAIFDTTETGTADPDLEGPPNKNWDGGNLPADTVVGKCFIVQENSTDADDDGVFDSPDDEAGGGDITIEFGRDISGFGFDFVDHEEVSETGHDEVHFYQGGTSGTEVNAIQFVEFTDGGTHDQDANFTDHSLNRIFLSESDIGGTYDTVEFHLSGSGGFSRLTPEPSAAALLALVGISLLVRRPRRR